MWQILSIQAMNRTRRNKSVGRRELSLYVIDTRFLIVKVIKRDYNIKHLVFSSRCSSRLKQL